MSIRTVRRALVRPGVKGVPGPGGDDHYVWADKVEDQFDEIIVDLQLHSGRTYASIALANADAIWDWATLRTTTYTAFLNDGTEIYAKPGDTVFTARTEGSAPTNVAYATIGLANADTTTWTFPVPGGEVYRSYLTDGTEIEALPGQNAFTAIADPDPRLGQLPTYAAIANANTDTATWTWPAPTGVSYRAMLTDGTELRALPGTSVFTAFAAGTAGDPYQETADATTRAAITGLSEGNVVKQLDDSSVWIHDGTALKVVYVAVASGGDPYSETADATTRAAITGLVEGNVVKQLDDSSVWVHDGAALQLIVSAAASGGDLYQETADATTRAAITGMVEGNIVKQLDDGSVWAYDGAALQPIFTPTDLGDPYSEVADAVALAAITGMVEGNLAKQLDNDSVHAYDGAAWQEIWTPPSTNWIEVPGDQATLSANGQHHLADSLSVAAPAVVAGNWFAVRSRGPGGSTVTGVTSGAIPGDGTVVYYVENAGAWERLPAASSANPTSHLTETAIAPAAAGDPTVAEITAAATAATLTDRILRYTGTDTATDPITRVYHVDTAGAVTLLLSPTAAIGDPYQEVLDATARNLVTGMVEGDVVKETSTGDVYKWDSAAWQLIGKTIITDPNYVPGAGYVTGDFVLSAIPVGSANGVAGTIARYEWTAADGTAGGGAPGAMDLAEEGSGNWTFRGAPADTFAGLTDTNMAGVQDGDAFYWSTAANGLVPGRAERFWALVPDFATVLTLPATIGDEVHVGGTENKTYKLVGDGTTADPTNGGHWKITGEQTNPNTWDATTADLSDTTFTLDVV